MDAPIDLLLDTPIDAKMDTGGADIHVKVITRF